MSNVNNGFDVVLLYLKFIFSFSNYSFIGKIHCLIVVCLS